MKRGPTMPFLLVIALVVGGRSEAQERTGAQWTAASLSATARRVSEEFADPATAAAAGYRRVGPDFPGMGEHWVQLGLLFSDGLDPEHPSVLCYTRIGGRSVLVNVAYALALPPGEAPPAVSGIEPGAWHTHIGTVAEEMLHPHGHGDPRLEEPGITMIHVWTKVENQDGPFAQHNWLLPFRRLSLPDPETPPGESAANAISLVTESGLAYHRDVVRLLFGDDTGRMRAGEGSLSRAVALAREVVDSSRDAGRVTAADLTCLEGIWRELGRELEALAPDARTRETVRMLHQLSE
jgi:hypothetical protein